MSQKFTSTIAGASIFISIIGLLSRGLGFIREMIFANNFGLETEFDLYLVGAVLPISINSVILYIGQNHFVPGFQKLSSTDSDSAQKYYKQSFILFVGGGTVIALLLFLTSDFIINFYMHLAPSESKEIAADIFNVFLLTIPFSAGISIFSALLQSVYEFKFPAISILFLNISIISLLVFLSDKFGVFIIPIGFVLGTILQFSYLLIKSRKYFRLNLSFRDSPFNLPRTLLSSSLLIIILIESLSQLYSIFDRYFYGNISSGGIAAMNYASIIWVLPIYIFSVSLATAVFPVISKAVNDSSTEDMEKIYNESTLMSTFIFMPIAFILFFYGDSIIRIFYERGKFVEESTAMTFGVLRIFSISLVFFAVYAVFNKIFYSLNETKLLLLITIAGLSIKLLFNFLLIDLEQNGLALSTSLSYLFFFFASYTILNIKLKVKNKSLFVKDFIIHSTNCIICLILIKNISVIYQLNNIFEEIFIIVLFVFIYLLNSFLIKHNALLISSRVIKRLNLNSYLRLDELKN